MRKPLAEPGEHARVGGIRIVADAFGTGIEQVLRQVVDVAMSSIPMTAKRCGMATSAASVARMRRSAIREPLSPSAGGAGAAARPGWSGAPGYEQGEGAGSGAGCRSNVTTDGPVPFGNAVAVVEPLRLMSTWPAKPLRAPGSVRIGLCVLCRTAQAERGARVCNSVWRKESTEQSRVSMKRKQAAIRERREVLV